MCCCAKPNVNGEPNVYSWDGKSFSTRPPNPPALAEDDELLYDMPGRCGGTDSHSHHFRVVKPRFGDYALLVRHGGGDERLPLGYDKKLVGPLDAMDDTTRYWFLMRLHQVHADAIRTATEETNTVWRKAAAEGRIKTRKQRGRDAVKVWIDPTPKGVEP